MAESVTVAGRTLTFPIEVRAASSWAATFLVPADAAQAIVDPTGLTVARVARKRAALTLVSVNYIDTDLDAYHELGVAFLVRPHDARGRGPVRALRAVRGDLAVYIHHLPVDQDFTLAAGHQIWGFPKFKAEIRLRDEGHAEVCELSETGTHILTLSVRNGSHFPVPTRALPAYSFLDGVLRRNEWAMPGVKIGGRIGGATLELGDHPIAEELRALGLPKRAAMTQTIPSMRARFDPARVIG